MLITLTSSLRTEMLCSQKDKSETITSTSSLRAASSWTRESVQILPRNSRGGMSQSVAQRSGRTWNTSCQCVFFVTLFLPNCGVFCQLAFNIFCPPCIHAGSAQQCKEMLLRRAQNKSWHKRNVLQVINNILCMRLYLQFGKLLKNSTHEYAANSSGGLCRHSHLCG